MIHTVADVACMTCRHFRGGPGKLAVCDAFPEGIRSEVLLGEHDHTTPLPGDHGILYVPKPGTIAPKSGTVEVAKDAGPWDEELHPRAPAGTPEGGEFIRADQIAAAPPEVAQAAALQRVAEDSEKKLNSARVKLTLAQDRYGEAILSTLEKRVVTETGKPWYKAGPGADDWYEAGKAIRIIEDEKRVPEEAKAIAGEIALLREEREKAEAESAAASSAAAEAHDKAVSKLAESRWAEHLESSAAPRMPKEQFDPLAAKEKDIRETDKYISEERRVNAQGYHEQSLKASEELNAFKKQGDDLRAALDKEEATYVERLKEKSLSGALATEYEEAQEKFKEADKAFDANDADPSLKAARDKADAELSLARANLRTAAGNASMGDESTISKHLIETTEAGKAYAAYRVGLEDLSLKLQAAHAKSEEADAAIANERKELLNEFAREAGPAYFHQKAVDDNRFYEENMDKMRGAWQHIGGEGPTRIRFAAQMAFEQDEGGAYDSKLGRFAKPEDYSGAGNDYTTVMWAGLMRREYEETQADIKSGKLDNLLAGNASGAADDDPEESWDEGDKYDEEQGRDDWVQSDDYSNAQMQAFEEYFDSISDRDKISNLFGKDEVDTIKAAWVEETSTDEEVREALGDDYRDPSKITDEEAIKRAIADKRTAEAYDAKKNAQEAWEKEHPQNKPLEPGKPFNFWDWSRERDAAGNAASNAVFTRPDSDFSISDNEKAEARESLEEDFTLLNRVDFFDEGDEDFSTLWEWGKAKTLSDLGVSSGARRHSSEISLNDYVLEREQEGFEFDDSDAWSEWWSNVKTDYETEAFKEAKAAYEAAQEGGDDYDPTASSGPNSPSRTGHVELIRKMSASAEGYVANFVESFSTKPIGWSGSTTLRSRVPASRILVFQGATNWRSGGPGSMGMKEWEVLVLSQAPKWYRDWWTQARRNREGKKAYDAGRKTDCRVHPGRPRGLRKARGDDRGRKSGRLYLIPKGLSSDPRAALKGDYWLRLQRRLILPWERDYRERYTGVMDALRVASTEELSVGDRKPFGLLEWSHKLRSEMEPLYYDLYRASREDYAEYSRSRKMRKATRPSINVIEIDNLLGRLDLSLETTHKILEDTLLRGIEEGWSREELARHFDESWDGMFGDNRRLDSIATTDTNSIVQVGRHSMMYDVENIEWISQRDAKVRENHMIYDSLGPVPYGYNFAKAVGEGYLIRFPMDPECEEPGEIINCRCTDVSSDEEFEGTEADLRALLADLGEPDED